MLTVEVRDVRRWDVIHFARYSLRVEAEPQDDTGGRVLLRGRSSADGCPLVERAAT